MLQHSVCLFAGAMLSHICRKLWEPQVAFWNSLYHRVICPRIRRTDGLLDRVDHIGRQVIIQLVERLCNCTYVHFVSKLSTNLPRSHETFLLFYEFFFAPPALILIALSQTLEPSFLYHILTLRFVVDYHQLTKQTYWRWNRGSGGGNRSFAEAATLFSAQCWIIVWDDTTNCSVASEVLELTVRQSFLKCEYRFISLRPGCCYHPFFVALRRTSFV